MKNYTINLKSDELREIIIALDFRGDYFFKKNNETKADYLYNISENLRNLRTDDINNVI